MRVEDGHQLAHFSERNAYLSDPAVPDLLERLLPSKILHEIKPDLVRLGAEAIVTVRAISERATPPRLTQYNHWGQRIDQLDTSEAWKELKGFFFKEGIPGIFYQREYGEFSRIYGFAKLHMLVGDSHVVGCPMSMTDGCARVLELVGTPEMRSRIFPRLISCDPSLAFTSGQWMTERPGGSDVSLTETIATPTEQSRDRMWPAYQLDGFKWFSSATDSDVAVALARTGDIQDGSRSLSLFLVPLRTPLVSPGEPNPSSTSNGIYTHRLKNKIGTHMVPTAELTLKSTTAYLLGSLNHGVKNILPVLYITRIHSAISGTGHLRKCLEIAIAYSKVRRISGGKQLLEENAIHVAQLAAISLVYRALVHLVFGTILFMGKVEAHVASKEDESLLRVLTAVVKAFTAEKAVSAMEECMTTLGGMGYMEEVGIGRSIRDALVEKIWEGTTSVLALDLMRSAANDPATFVALRNWGTRIFDSCPPALADRVRASLDNVKAAFETIHDIYSHPKTMSPLLPRPALMLVGHAAAATMLLEHAVWSHNMERSHQDADAEVFVRWVNEGGLSSTHRDVLEITAGRDIERISMNHRLVYGPPSGSKL